MWREEGACLALLYLASESCLDVEFRSLPFLYIDVIAEERFIGTDATDTLNKIKSKQPYTMISPVTRGALFSFSLSPLGEGEFHLVAVQLLAKPYMVM